MLSHRPVGLLLLCTLLAALPSCAHTQKHPGPAGPGAGPPTAALPPAGDSPVVIGPVRAIDSQEEADIARQDLDYVSLLGDASARQALLRALLRFHTSQGDSALRRGHPDEAFESFSSALSLFDPQDLMDPAHPPAGPEVGGLLSLAQQLDKAFRRRGAHAQVITALFVEQSLSPGDDSPRRRYRELASWLAGPPEATGPAPPAGARSGAQGDFSALVEEVPEALVRDLEQAVKLWPAPAAVQELSALYKAEGQGLGISARRMQNPQDLLSLSLRRQGPAGSPAFRLARLYLRVSRPQEGLAAVKLLGKPGRDERALIGLLENTFAPGAPPTEAVRLAALLSQNPDDQDVGLQVCRDVVRAHPDFLNGYLCVGELAVQLDRKGLALRAFERARDLKTGDHLIWEKLGRLYQERLRDLVGDERTAELQAALRAIEQFQAHMQKQFPAEAPGDDLAGPLAEVGRGYYNAGRIGDAVQFLSRSIAVMANAPALELLGTIYLKRDQAREALSTLERARAVELTSRQGEALVKVYFKAHIGRLIAEALDLQDEQAGPERKPETKNESRRAAAELRRACLHDWEQILEVEQLAPERRAEAEVERGKLYYKLGDRAEALSAFDRAIAAVPEEGNKDQGQVYADTIAFLVQQGELSAALDAYHRALGRARVVEYLKVYSSLWVNDLARRSGQPEDPLATAFLRSVSGGKWYADLARWATGQLPTEELLRRADTVGKKAEAHFYLGMQQIQLGNKEKGEAMLRNVLSSEMMAFFEYEMSANYLKHGAPTTPVLKSRPSAPGGKAPPKAPKRPAGSI